MDILKRFAIAFGLVLLFMAGWAGVLLFLIKGLGIDEPPGVLWVILGFFVVFLLTFLPYLHFVGKWAFHFRGEGAPVSGDELRSRIRRINDLDVPIMVQEKEGRFVVTWKYLDAKWWEILAKSGLRKIYQLIIKFNDREKEVIMIDIIKSVSWRAGTGEVKIRGGYFRGISLEYEIGKQWGIKEKFELGKIYDYKF